MAVFWRRRIAEPRQVGMRPGPEAIERSCQHVGWCRHDTRSARAAFFTSHRVAVCAAFLQAHSPKHKHALGGFVINSCTEIDPVASLQCQHGCVCDGPRWFPLQPSVQRPPHEHRASCGRKHRRPGMRVLEDTDQKVFVPRKLSRYQVTWVPC